MVCPLYRICYCVFSLVHWTTPHSSVICSRCIDTMFSVVMVGTQKFVTPFVISPVQLGTRQGNVISKWLQQYLLTISQSVKELHLQALVVPCFFLSFGNDLFVPSRPDASSSSSDKFVFPSHWTKSEICMRLRYFRITVVLSRDFPLCPFSIVTSIIDWSPC